MGGSLRPSERGSEESRGGCADQGSCEDERVGELFPVSLHNIPPEYAPR
jgi:hypothetical protein